MDKLKKLKEVQPSFVILVVSSTLTVFFLGHIILWYFNGTSTDELLDTINTAEVVGFEVPKASAEEPTEPEFPFAPVDFTDLEKRNSDTVAWLKVDAVDINIPIVQTVDNDFYLSHDIDKKANNLGWVFADARSNLDFLGTNTVLYGHNTANRQMFGSLKELLKTDPEKKEQNEVIQFTTPDKEMVFEIVSVYVTDFTDWKYVQQTFSGEEDKRAFINRMEEKNTMKIFGKENLSVHDNFLTFSTCYGPAGTSDRLVVHARLVAER